jgi:hypothetical protein
VHPAGLLIVARTLAVDKVTAEVVAAMQRAGVEPILIKGPTLGKWLYDDQPRGYLDSDLVVDPARQAEAGRVLSALGFERHRYAWEIRRRLFHAGTWFRASDRGVVDLHLTLPGIRGASPEEVWAAISGRTVDWQLPGGVAVRAPDLATRALIVGLHAVHHLEHGAPERPLADLERAIDRAGTEVWQQAAALAEELRSGADLARALDALERGRELGRRIGLPAPASGREAAAGIERILATRGVRERGRAVRRALVPSPSYLRYTLPSARRGPVWLALAYVRRPFWLAAEFPKAYRAWRAGEPPACTPIRPRR